MAYMSMFIAPFRGSPPVTQGFGEDTPGVEPAGSKAADGSINYAGNGQPGHWHNGIDYGLPCGTPLYAGCDGTVAAAGMSPSGFGLRVMIQSDQGLTILTGHMSSILVRQGQHVSQGQPIGQSGNTGNSTGCHLHVSIIRPDGSYTDPAAVLATMPPPAPPPDASRITFVSFGVVTQRDGGTRVWDGPSERLKKIDELAAGTSILCDAWCEGAPKWDNIAHDWDRRWYHKSSGGWVASARVVGNAPSS